MIDDYQGNYYSPSGKLILLQYSFNDVTKTINTCYTMEAMHLKQYSMQKEIICLSCLIRNTRNVLL